jgi:hypothetical protein
MGDHTAYFRTAPGEEELAFVRLARKLAGKCKAAKWYDSHHYHYVEKPREYAHSKRQPLSGSHQHLSLSEILGVDVESLGDLDFAERLKRLGGAAENAFYFDAVVADGHEVAGYLCWKLDTRAYQAIEAWEPIRLSMEFRLFRSTNDDAEADPDELDSRARSVAFICGASIDEPPVSNVSECVVVHEGAATTSCNIFSKYCCSTHELAAELRDLLSLTESEEGKESTNQAAMQPLDGMDDCELLRWYLDIANHLPRYWARQAGRGTLTSTTEAKGMYLLHEALLKSLE